jgi:hypothetical protein
MRRDDRGDAVELCFSKNECEDRDIQIYFNNEDVLFLTELSAVEDLGKKRCGVMLSTRLIIGTVDIDGGLLDIGLHTKNIPDPLRQWIQTVCPDIRPVEDVNSGCH